MVCMYIFFKKDKEEKNAFFCFSQKKAFKETVFGAERHSYMSHAHIICCMYVTSSYTYVTSSYTYVTSSYHVCHIIIQYSKNSFWRRASLIYVTSSYLILHVCHIIIHICHIIIHICHIIIHICHIIIHLCHIIIPCMSHHHTIF